MKCKCENCNGRGRVVCEECDGRGELDQSIEHIELLDTLASDHPQLAELKALQSDARRCREQAEKLTQLNPSRAASYAEQLRGTLNAIERLAEKAYAKK